MKTQKGRITIPKTAGLSALWLSFLGCIAPEFSAQKPNVLLAMADDLGAENLACYRNTFHQTPVLERMAAEGARFENAFSTPVCAPTRALILTGLYPNRNGFS